MAFGSRTVAQRDVNFNVNLGQFRAQLGEATTLYARSTGAMSTEALKLSVAEERVARAIKAHGAESLAARQATVAYRREVEGLTASTVVSRDALLSEERALGRFTRGAVAGSGAARGLGRSLAFSSAAFLGAAGLVYALRTSIKAAEDHQVVIANLKNAVQDAGLSWQQYSGDVTAALDAQRRQTAFSDTDLASSLALFIRRYGDVNLALKANALAADVARGKNEDLAAAQKQVVAASLGNSRGNRALDIAPIVKVTTAVDALKATTKHATAEQLANAKAADVQATATKTLAAIEAAYHGAAAKYLQTDAGKQALLNVELKRSEEIIGNAVLPTLIRYEGKLASYLDKLNRTGKLERDVHKITTDLGEAFHGVGDGVHLLKDVLDPLNSLLGGVRHSMELVTLAFVAFKARGVAAFVKGALEVEAATPALVAANDAGTAAAAAEATAEARAAAGAGAGNVVRTVLKGAGVLAAPLLLLDALQGKEVPAYTDPKTGAQVTFDPKTKQFYSGYPGKPRGKISSSSPEAAAAIRYYQSQGLIPTTKTVTHVGSVKGPGGASGYRKGAPGGSTGGSTGGAGGGGGLVLGLTNAQLTPLLLAEGTPGTRDDQTALQAQLAIYNRLLAQKGLNAAQKNDLLSGRNSVTGQLSALQSGNAAAAKAISDKAAAAHRKAEQERKKEAAAAAHARKKTEEEAAKDRKALVAGLEQAPTSLRIQLQTAIANNDPESTILKLLRLERKAIDEQVVELRKIGASKNAELKARTNEAAVQKQINAITKKKNGAGGALARELQDAVAGLAQYAPNVTEALTGTHVTVHQHFPGPPSTDGNREAIYARHAIGAAFDG